MKKQPLESSQASGEAPELTISPESVCWVIVKVRDFDVKEGVTDPDSGSNPSDDKMIDVLESSPDDPVEEELRAFIGSLSDDEKIDLVALAWLGRDDSTLEDWPSLRAEAARAHANRAENTSDYLLGEPLLSDFLEEGLAMLGHTCEALEADRL